MADYINRELPMDRGWAWVVLFGCTCNFAMIVGTLKSFGIFFIEFLVMFDASVSMTSMIAGLMQITYSFVSLPIMAVGLRHINPRQCVLCGALVATLAYALGSLAPNINFLLFTHGILFGIAFGFFHGPSTYVIGQYFEKRRSLANACMVAGGSIGGLVLPSFFQNLLETYGLRGALLLTSAVIFHTAIGAMLMRPPTYYHRPCNQDDHFTKENKDDDGLIKNGQTQGENFNNKEQCQLSAGNTACSAQHKLSLHCPKNVLDSCVKQIGNDVLVRSNLNDNDNSMDHHKNMSDTSQNSDRKQFSGSDYIQNSNVSLADKNPRTRSISNTMPECTNHKDGKQKSQESHQCNDGTEVLPLDPETSETLLKSDVVRKAKGSQYTSFSSHCDLFTNSLTDISQMQASADLFAQEATGDVNSLGRERKSCLSVFLIDLSLLRNPDMLLFLFVYCLGSIGSVYGHIYIAALARDIGINSGQITLLVSTLSGCDVIGRLICGAVVDRMLMTSHRVTSLTVIITGIMMLLAHLYQQFWSLLLYSILHGLFAGGIFALTPAILIDMLGFENFRNAMGIAIFAQGFSLVSSAPFIGFLRDRTHTYVSSFLFMGSCMVLAGITLLLKPVIFRLMCRHKETDSINSSET